MSTFCVCGSLNMDMVTRVERFPLPGETISGLSFNIFPGGKGANQAVALGRLGCSVEMIGAIGDDLLGSQYREVLANNQVGHKWLIQVPQTGTGTASIEVIASGENHIIVVPAANLCMTPDLVRHHRAVLENSDFLLLQLEIPLTSIIEAASIARSKNRQVILDPAPACVLPEELYQNVTIITPNETEAMILTGFDTSTESGVLKAGLELLSRGVSTVIIKAGKRGAFLITAQGQELIPGFPVKTIDTIAAGDSFNAGLACALGKGKPLAEAIRFANAVAAISTTREGAQTAMPTLEEAMGLFLQGHHISQES